MSLTRTSYENGGRKIRRRTTAIQKLTVEAYKRHSEVENCSDDEN
jgi:hypothetical protein